jgi:hypothetical protein
MVMRGSSLADKRVISRLNSDFVPFELNVTDQGFPKTARALTPLKHTHTKSRFAQKAFASSTVLTPDGEDVLGNSGTGFRWQAETATNYNPDQFLIYLDDAHRRYQRRLGLSAPSTLEAHNLLYLGGQLRRHNVSDRELDTLLKHFSQVAIALTSGPSSKALPGEVEIAHAYLRSILENHRIPASDLVRGLASNLAPTQQGKEAGSLEPLIALLDRYSVSGADLWDLAEHPVRGALKKGVLGQSACQAEKREGERVFRSFLSKYQIPLPELYRAGSETWSRIAKGK